MPRNPTTGVYTRPDNSFSNPVYGTVIDPEGANALFDDYDAVITGTPDSPASSTDNAIARFDGTTGRFLQNSGITIDDSDNISGVASLGLDNAGWIKARNSENSTYLNVLRVNGENFSEWSNPLYFDSAGNFIDRSAVLNIYRSVANGGGVLNIQPSVWVETYSSGNNSHSSVIGSSCAFFKNGDAAGTTGDTKGALYGVQFQVAPLVDRDDTPYDDAVAAQFVNSGTGKATEIIYVDRNAGITWDASAAIGVAANANSLLYGIGTYDVVFNLCYENGGATGATVNTAFARIPNAKPIQYRNSGNSGFINAISVDNSDRVALANGSVTIGTGGTIAGNTFNRVTITAPASGSTLTIADGATLSAPSSATVSGTNTGDQTVTGTSDRISVSGGAGTTPTIDISASYVGQTSITMLGTIVTGTWSATKIGLAYGGTNADLSATGGTGRFLKQASSGAAITVVQPTFTDLSDYTDWTSWVPTVTPSGGSITTGTVTARYTRSKNTKTFSVAIQATADSGTGTLTVTLPTTPSKTAVAVGYNTANGRSLTGQISSGSANMILRQYDSAYPGAGGATTYLISGQYESQ